MTRRWRTKLADLAGRHGRSALLHARAEALVGYRTPTDLEVERARARRRPRRPHPQERGLRAWASRVLAVYTAALHQFADPRTIEAASVRTLASLRGGSPRDPAGSRETLAVRALLRQDGLMHSTPDTYAAWIPRWFAELGGGA